MQVGAISHLPSTFYLSFAFHLSHPEGIDFLAQQFPSFVLSPQIFGLHFLHVLLPLLLSLSLPLQIPVPLVLFVIPRRDRMGEGELCHGTFRPSVRPSHRGY